MICRSTIIRVVGDNHGESLIDLQTAAVFVWPFTLPLTTALDGIATVRAMKLACIDKSMCASLAIQKNSS